MASNCPCAGGRPGDKVLEPFLTNTPRSHWPQAIVIYHTGDIGGLVARLCAPGHDQPVHRTRRNALPQLGPG
jgi:hypothetical protein